MGDDICEGYRGVWIGASPSPNDQVNRRAARAVRQKEAGCRRVRLNAGLGRTVIDKLHLVGLKGDCVTKA